MMFVSAVFALSIWFLALGGLLYFIEFCLGRVTMGTRWGDLDDVQLPAAVLVVVGTLGFVGSLVVGAISKGL